MASDVVPRGLPLPVSAQPMAYAADGPDDHRAYDKIIHLRDKIWAGDHPRYKPPTPVSAQAVPSRPLPATNGQLGERGRHPPPPPPPAPPAAPAAGRASLPAPARTPTASAQAAGQGQIDNVLLTKSDVLIKAEMSLKRERIEKELKAQLEQRSHEARMGMDVRHDEDVDLDDAISRAGIHVKQLTRPESPRHYGSKLENLAGQHGPEHETSDYTEKKNSTDMRSDQPDDLTHRNSSERRTNIDPAYASAPQSRTGQADLTSPRSRGGDIASNRNSKVPSSSGQADPGAFSRDTILPAVPERGFSPSQPRYSATSQVRSPAAPQPVRPANVARVESQDHRMIIDLEINSGRGYSPLPANGRTPIRRVSPIYVKPEPISSPDRRESVILARRPQSPDRVLLAPSRTSHYASRPAYEYHPAPPPPPGYHYPPPAYARHPYDPYAYREVDPYAYPIEYARSYPAGYPPPQAPPSFYPPRPVYDDYAVRYTPRPPPPPPPPIRQPSRADRRSRSPQSSYIQPRRSSRSASPVGRARRRDSPPPQSPTGRYKAPHSPSPPPRTGSIAYRVPEAPIPVRRPDPYHQPYGPPDPYYAERFAYPQGPPERYLDEPRAMRAESAMIPREADPRSYRERDYYPPPPPVVRHQLHPPPSPYHPPPYQPMLHDYSRAASRAPPMGPPDVVEYAPRPGGDYYSRGSAIPEGREFAGRASVRPDEARYIGSRQPSARPEPGSTGVYDERDRQPRSSSIRPGLEAGRYREGIPPPPPPPPAFSDRSYGERGERYERGFYREGV